MATAIDRPGNHTESVWVLPTGKGRSERPKTGPMVSIMDGIESIGHSYAVSGHARPEFDRGLG
jgi:hypothetical protein